MEFPGDVLVNDEDDEQPPPAKRARGDARKVSVELDQSAIDPDLTALPVPVIDPNAFAIAMEGEMDLPVSDHPDVEPEPQSYGFPEQLEDDQPMDPPLPLVSSLEQYKTPKAPRKRHERWSAEQDQALLDLVAEKPTAQWKDISAELKFGHSGVACRARHKLLVDKRNRESFSDRCSLNARLTLACPVVLDAVETQMAANNAAAGATEPPPPPKRRTPFTEVDDAFLLEQFEVEGSISWSAVGLKMNPPRTGDSCYQRARKLIMSQGLSMKKRGRSESEVP
ncbi:hypothetical protein JCM5296_002345 [Sporobolomyces johnsonii]